MSSITDAKRHLADRFRSAAGFVGVGTFRQASEEGLRVYVVDRSFPIAEQLAGMASFEGYPVQVEVLGAVNAQGG